MENRNVTYYKIAKNISFSDGYELTEGTIVRYNDRQEGEVLNVSIESKSEKRIFWVHQSLLTKYKTKKEKWSKAKIEENEIDLNGKWLENEKRNTGITKGNSTIETKTRRIARPARATKVKRSDNVPPKKRAVSKSTSSRTSSGTTKQTKKGTKKIIKKRAISK